MKIVSYRRVSTTKQGDSGLGLEAQEQAVAQFAKSNGGTIIAAFTEVESGRKSSRPQLAAAIAACRQHGAKLVVAKLDRLSRNAAFTAALLDSDVDFVACDNPHANRLTIQILAAIAEHEARQTATRTREALAELKEQGVKLGNPNAAAAIPAAVAANQKLAADHAATVRPIAEKLRNAKRSLQAIADHLTANGYSTRRGNRWTATAVSRLLAC
jgi:DNA invertase Pin-like site-specific DNA recombinase